ncbi:two-component system, OmpR family, sensor histidine kinase CreC [Roseateles sp. YR242]|uniref:two-component system sensor histidine kinase CreC n=1 Tax=Roseateles sp. YR242 TaxID=1855305 RepID=UPI0008CDA2BB|nr:two-component system sensor histidine kinase CreC [Roseateles sp. YR242]SEL76580.1 two-component system, OmpR family, sensor histidine kinase CreC [Roseateles sp. YR242]
MRLGLRVFFGFFLIAGLSSLILLRVVLGEVKPSVREVMEDIMVDTANLLAELAADDLASLPAGGALDQTPFARQVRDYANRPVDVHIWGLRKQTLDFRIYVTDPQGQVIFDTVQGPGSALGQDYSRWNDVARTLRGGYGARSTQDRYGGDVSPVMYVAAPVYAQGRLLGVLTVAKPVATVQRFIDRAERRIWAAGLGLLAVSLAIGVAVTLWVVGHVRRLRRYAQGVQMGQRQPPPKVPGELGELAQAMDAMRERLDGRERMEHLARALTHELKSPLAALRGAGELLQDDLAPADRQRFAAQVVAQSERMTELVERLLALSALELRRGPEHPRALRVDEAVDLVLAEAGDRLQQRDMTVHWQRRDLVTLQADPELLSLALSNLLSNAVDFSPPGSTLTVSVGQDGAGACWFELRDHGPGVPAAAFGQLGQRFFSTARPGSLRKGSGLGLAIVRQIAGLHGWQLSFLPADPGLRVRLDFAPHFTRTSQTSP